MSHNASGSDRAGILVLRQLKFNDRNTLPCDFLKRNSSAIDFVPDGVEPKQRRSALAYAAEMAASCGAASVVTGEDVRVGTGAKTRRLPKLVDRFANALLTIREVVDSRVQS